MNHAELRSALRSGHPVDPTALDDWEYRGTSLGRLAWKTFQKVFHRDPANGTLRGWNVRVEQHGIGAASVPRQRRGRPLTFGHFEVVPLPRQAAPWLCGEGLLLDYGRGGNRRLD